MAATKKELETLFLHNKPARLITKLRGQKKYASILAKEVDCTYSHCVRILQDMKKMNLVDFENKGRIKFVSLTQLGEDVAYAVDNVYRVFGKVE